MTIYDIANEAGVSITTVSRVINGKSGIKESTRIKVQEVLDKYNYAPSLAAKGLVSKCMDTIAILMCDIRDEHYAATAYTIEQEINKIGYSCLLCNTGIDYDRMVECLQTMSHRQVDGVILIGSIFQNKVIKKAIKQCLANVPIVMANGYLDLPNVCGVLCDDKLGIRQAVDYLVKKGHKAIAYVKDGDTPSSKLKKEGYVEGMLVNGLQEYTLIEEATNSFEAGIEITQHLLEQNNEVTAIIYGEDLTAIGGLRAIKKMTDHKQSSIAVIGFNNSTHATICTPTLTSVDNKLDVMGIKCAQALEDMIEQKSAVAQMLLIPNLVERESTK